MAVRMWTDSQHWTRLRGLSRGNLGVPLLLLALLGMMVLPLPPLLLDVLFSFNIALSIVVLLVSVYAMRALDFAVFPTILLVATLLRLALNVASTRVVLLRGHEGGDAAGKVIQAFGEVVIGGNYAVGMVVFLILMIINFVVVTKGAGRISEVSARFTLDAMPGKQMAIDADLNAGIIDQNEARLRREEVASEADFYGSMDGASKFVRGDAIAGVLILFINILGGLGIGMLQHDLDFSRAMAVYSLLTIGDGLVAQLPSLLLSTSAAIMVTRVSSARDMGEQIVSQMFDSPRALAVTAVILGAMGLVPGMPHLAFLGLALLAGGGAWLIARQRRIADLPAAEGSAEEARVESGAELPELGWSDVQTVDVIGLEVGYRLIPLVDRSQGGELLARIKGVRKKLSQQVGFLIPTVHIRDNLELSPNSYRIHIMGVTRGQGEIYPDRDLAINPGQVFGSLEGRATRDPAFGLEAVWIDPGQRDHAQSLGYTVVDAGTVVATHLNQLLLRQVSDLLGYDEVQKLLELLRQQSPRLAEDLVPTAITMNRLLLVLKSLLQEQVPIRDLRTIAETLAAQDGKSSDVTALTSAVRVALGPIIVQTLFGDEDPLPVLALEGQTEQLLLQALQQSRQSGQGDDIVLEPGLAERLQQALREGAQQQELAGKPAVLLVSAALRPVLARFARYVSSDFHVLAYPEIPEDKSVTIEASIG